MHTSSERLDYIIMPGKPRPDFSDLGLYNRSYVYWKKFWNSVMKDVGENGGVDPDAFYRQDCIVAIMNGQEFVAMHCYTFFDLQQMSAREHSYFRGYFTPEYFSALEARQARYVMSLEYLTVDPEWRASKTGISMARVIIGLGLKLAAERGANAGIAAARVDVGVDRMVHELGGVSLVKNLQIHGKPTDLVAFFLEDIYPSQNSEINRLVDQLWHKRTDLVVSETELLRRSA